MAIEIDENEATPELVDELVVPDNVPDGLSPSVTVNGPYDVMLTDPELSYTPTVIENWSVVRLG